MLLRLLLLMLWGGPLAQGSRSWLKLQKLVTVQESLCVVVPCKFSHSWFISKTHYIFWLKKGVNTNHDLLVATNKPGQKVLERTQGRFFLPKDPLSNDCSLSIRDVHMRDSGLYFLRIENYFANTHSYTDEMLFLKVTALNHTPDILIPGTLESGRPTDLTCSVPWACERGTPPLFSWMSAAHTSLGPRTYLSSTLTLTPQPKDHGTKLTCQVWFPATDVTVETTIQLNITYAPQNMAVHIIQGNSTGLKILQTTSLSTLEGEALRLLCVADSNPPAVLSWFRGFPAMNTTFISNTGILELPCVGTAEEGQYTCQAQHPLGSQNLSLSLSVVYPPRLLGHSCSWEDENLNCSCSSQAQPAPLLRWRLGEGLLEMNNSNTSYTVTSSSEGPWANSSLNLHAGLGSELRLSCEVENVHGAQSASVLLLLPEATAGSARRLEDKTLSPVSGWTHAEQVPGGKSSEPVPALSTWGPGAASDTNGA
ncbi:sialic acid-binding Ig-like lectin 5 isoform X2 [Artibeus jamaicensis]|uniref:sialic acid-binding Ig-like lectin 5 isoform X2 n=1 Tax=Artibeus jamaicensis TaxID=9417 RepID=UPI00235A984B|nr:sialic acid-binding Ig-like lectin 5 isoform X2 [Artibeus jamaicensis]XP_037007434.2 sialic acid-binding Ig-like lectin 5 isoform X2 [Artibeus jamaicensis]